MDDPSLLDEMTQILAYIGDKEAQDGYYIGKNSYGNPKYSVEIRGEPLSKSEIAEFEKKMIQIFVKFKRDILSSIEPDDVKTKVNNLYEKYLESTFYYKNELRDYLSPPVPPVRSVTSPPVRSVTRLGGRRNTNKRRNTKKRRNNKKTRRNRH